jgi:hypothetical protein
MELHLGVSHYDTELLCCPNILVDASTPRDGTTRNPFQQDSTRFKNQAADACGETLGGGTNDPATQIPQMLAANGGQMPQISAGGMVMMTLHQVNGDGAGPYDCMIDSTGAGTQWTNMQVATNVPGTNSRSKAKATDFVSFPYCGSQPIYL